MTVTLLFGSDGALAFIGSGRHGSGQVLEYLTKDNPAPGFTSGDCLRLKQAWQRWHLNHMRAGTYEQERMVREWREFAPGSYDYQAACKMLEEKGLLIDNGYKYGSAWLKEEVPSDVLEWLFSLPGEGDTFYDIFTPTIDYEDFKSILNLTRTNETHRVSL